LPYEKDHPILAIAVLLNPSCKRQQNANIEDQPTNKREVTAKDILGNSAYPAISFGGYRAKSRDIQPTVQQLKEDMKILSALNIRMLRTYNVQLPHASNVLKAIRELKEEDPDFEMYVMLGAWIDCLNAWTDKEPDHNTESPQNEEEIARAVALANEYPDIVKVLAVGNEAMVKWAASYYVQPSVILKWVRHLQELKANGELPKDLWITSSDDFASWGGGDPAYHNADLEALIREVDFVSMHTYPYHNTHYNPEFWFLPEEENNLDTLQQADRAMERAVEFAKSQYEAVSAYVHGIEAQKSIHIGETGWATVSNGHYGSKGSRASDEYKQALYYKMMREWTTENDISCFYFEAFDEPWKDGGNPQGSENHFGLFTVDGKAKFAIWDQVDAHVFDGHSRDGNKISKTYHGDSVALVKSVMPPPRSPNL